MGWFSNLKLFGKMMVLAIILQVILAGTVYYNIRVMYGFQQDLEGMYKDSLMPIEHLGAIAKNTMVSSRDVSDHLASTNPDEMQKLEADIKQKIEENNKLLVDFKNTVLSDDEKELFGEYEPLLKKFRALRQEVLRLSFAGRKEEAIYARSYAIADREKLDMILDDLITLNQIIAEDRYKRDLVNYEINQRNSVIIVVFGILLGLFIAFIIARIINRPLRILEQAANQVAAGDLAVSWEIKSRDEIGSLAASLAIMLQNLRQAAEDMYRTVFENTGTATLIIDQDMIISRANSEFEMLSGYTKAELEGKKSWAELVVLNDMERMKEYHRMRRTEGNDAPRRYEFSYTDRQGNRKDIYALVALLPDKKRSVASLLDITERKRAERELFTEKERLLVTLYSIGDGVIATDKTGRITLLNRVAQKLTGWNQEEALGKPLDQVFDIINEITREACVNPVAKILQEGVVVGLANHTAMIARDGTERSIADSGAPIHDKDGNVIGAVLVFRDITEAQAIQEQIRFLSFYDKLTGIYNRAFAEQELQGLEKDDSIPLSIIMGDANGLKLVNDAFGHLEGDKLLLRIAQIIKASCREKDIVARWGGDEFIVLMPEATYGDAMEVCERIRKYCADSEGYPVKPSIALGVATRDKDNQSFTEVLREADDRMYRNKLMENKSTRSSIILSLQKTLAERTHETEEHAMRLKNLALEMGNALRLSGSQIDDLALLAVLHDIGKIAIPDSILLKPGNLTPDEWEVMKRHSEIGFRIAQTSHELSHIAGAILSHHERWDGTGYPQGLKGTETPIISRIIAIIDSYDVITHKRPYKEAASPEEALNDLERCAASQFDPELIKVFLKMVKDIHLTMS